MTNPDPITPSELLAFAERCETRSNTGRLSQDFHDIARDARAIAGELRTDLEREQADEKRIDEYARAYWAAQRETQNLPHDYDKIPGGLLAAHRAGIRAVLAKLNEEKAAEEPQNACESELTEIERMIAAVKDRAQEEPDFPEFRRLTAKLAELENRRREILGGAL